MSSPFAAFVAVLAVACPAAASAGDEVPPLFPVPKVELVIEPHEEGPDLLDLVRQYAEITDQHVVLTASSREGLEHRNVILDRPVRVPPPEVQSYFENVLAQNDCLLLLLRARAPRLITVLPMNYQGRQAVNLLSPSPHFVPIERIEELRDHPALFVRTVLSLEHADVRQLANGMRSLMPQGSGLSEMLVNLGGSNALILQGRGSAVADLVTVLRLADASGPAIAPPVSPAAQPAAQPPAAPAPTPAPKVIGSSQLARIKSDIITIDVALQSYAISNGMKYPDSLEVLIAPDESGEKWLDMDKLPVDPWKQRYWYEPPSSGQNYRIYTLGADGRPGGTGKDRDIDHAMIKSGDV